MQGTDAMYNFVLKLNLATREGKELFMRKWAIGRIANGESISPREGWQFLQSLGIDVPKVLHRAVENVTIVHPYPTGRSTLDHSTKWKQRRFFFLCVVSRVNPVHASR